MFSADYYDLITIDFPYFSYNLIISADGFALARRLSMDRVLHQVLVAQGMMDQRPGCGIF